MEKAKDIIYYEGLSTFTVFLIENGEKPFKYAIVFYVILLIPFYKLIGF